MEYRSWFLTVAALIILSVNSFTQIVDQDYARKLAFNTFSDLKKGSGTAIITGDSVIYDDNHLPLLYIFNESKGGFIFISADKRTYPLLCWSDFGSFSTEDPGLPPAFQEMIGNWKEQISYCRTQDLSPGIGISDLWTRLEKGELAALNGTKDIAPLLSTKWSQSCGYNALCPTDAGGPCGRALTGCVATAMAQVLRYNMHPQSGTGTKCYNTYRYGELCADFSDGSYDYAAMSNTSGNAAVAKLMYHCGVSISMNYGPSSSSASSGSVASAMRTYFDYANGLILSKTAYPEENWEALIRGELEKGRVVYYSGFGSVGHAFVLDGWKETDFFHVNWGWGGSYDGYFLLSSLNPGSMTFNNGQQAIVGMIPVPQFTGLSFLTAVDLMCQTPAQGNLALGIDNVNYYKNIYPATPGKELVYKITTTLPGRIKIRITNESEPVYTFLLDYPDKDSLVTYGTNGVVVDNTAPGTYYVVVESNNFSEPSFTIEAVCPTLDADIDITSASVTPGYVQSLQANVRFSAKIKNIGKTSAPSCQMEYFLSEDTQFDPGNDKLIGAKLIPSVDPGETAEINSVCSMPDNLLPGYYNLLFVADRLNAVIETDEENIFSVNVTVPETGKLDCASSVSLADGSWHYGNSKIDGFNNVEKYSAAYEMTGPEVIHTFVSPYNGLMKISFVDKSPGVLYAFILPVCNEFTSEQPLRVWNITDTLLTEYFYVSAGTIYYIVIDGAAGASGIYGLRVDLPKECPETELSAWGSLDMCNGDPWPGLRANMGHSLYQWYRDGVEITGAGNYYYYPSSTGSYYVEITENGCVSSSELLTLRSDPRPETAHISITGAAIFCPGGSVMLKLENSISSQVNWAVDDILIPGATSNTYHASMTGSYSLYAVNGACKVKSDNSIDVTVKEPPAGLGDTLPFPSDKIRFYCQFNEDGYSNHTGGGEKESATMMGWDYEPVDDRFGNFWKARFLMGDDEYLYWPENDTISDEFTLALWFMTTTESGGVIAGFYDTPYNPSKSEAMMYMSDNGRMHFWLSNGGSPREISTTSSYNDGKWHYAMISHDGGMTIEIDDGAEKITSTGPFSKERFPGYWIFGGPSLPLSVSEMPSSRFYRGAIDDILCLDETNKFTTPYMIHAPRLKLDLTEPLPVCTPTVISLRMPYSQKGVEYKVWDRTRSVWAPVSDVGDGGEVQFGEAEAFIGLNELQVVARDIATECETVLDTVIIAEVGSVCTSFAEVQPGRGLRVYPVPASELVFFESEIQIDEVRIFDTEGKFIAITCPCSNYFEIDVGSYPPSIYYYQLKRTDNIILSGRFIVTE